MPRRKKYKSISSSTSKKFQGGSQYFPPEKGEYHLPGANYAGPGTQVRKRVSMGIEGTTNSDKAAKVHDVQYTDLRDKVRNNEISKEDAEKEARASDNLLLYAVRKNLISLDPLEVFHSNAINAGISSKKMLEDVGLLNKLKYLKIGKIDPVKKLRNNMTKTDSTDFEERRKERETKISNVI